MPERTKTVSIRFSPDEEQSCRTAAAQEGLTLSEWLRRVVMRPYVAQDHLWVRRARVAAFGDFDSPRYHMTDGDGRACCVVGHGTPRLAARCGTERLNAAAVAEWEQAV